MADQTTPAPSTSTSAGGGQSGHTPLTYRVEMTMAWFRDVYKQQNMAYYRKMGIFCLVFGIPLTLVSLYILISDPSETTLESIGAIALFGALSVMGVMMMQGKGIMMRTRKGELSSFFATHGMPDPHGPYSLEDLHCEYDVTVRDLGFEEAVTFENGLKLVTKQPWVVLTGKGGEAQGGLYLRRERWQELVALVQHAGHQRAHPRGPGVHAARGAARRRESEPVARGLDLERHREPAHRGQGQGRRL